MSNSDLNSTLLHSPNPFGGIIARSAWDQSPDVESINGSLTLEVTDLLQDVKDNNYTKIMLVQGQPGIGKTHFISRLRRLSTDKNFLFVAVRPISSVTSIFSHIYREIFTSLRVKTGDKFNAMEKLVGYIISTALINVLLERRRSGNLSQRLQDLLDKLQKDSTIILELIDQPNSLKLLAPIQAMAIKRIEKDHPDVDVSFLKVLFTSLDSSLHDDAMRWLQGDDIDDDVLAKLGVKESIVDEAIAQRVLHSIMTLSDQPILLCFDQLESIYDRFHDPYVIVTFFDTLIRICNETPNALILLMIQSIIWDKFREEDLIQRSAFDRIEYVESLNSPNFDEMIQLISKRMNIVWSANNIHPQVQTYPFSDKYIEGLSESVGWNPRSVLKQLSIEFNNMKRSNSFGFLNDYAHVVQVSQVPQELDLPTFFSNQIKRIVTNYEEIVKDQSYATKESYLEAGFFDLFEGMKELNSTINASKVIDANFKKKTHELDIILTVANAAGETENWGVEIFNKERGQSFYNLLKNIQRLLASNSIQRWFVIRDASLPIKRTWKKSLELMETLSPQGQLLPIESEEDITIFACEELLNLSSAGDLEVDHTTVSRKQVLPYLVTEVVPQLSIVSKCFGMEITPPTSPKPPQKKQKSFNEDEIKKKIVEQTENTTLVSINKFFSDFEAHKDLYTKIVTELVDEGKILILGDTENQIVVTKPLADDVF